MSSAVSVPLGLVVALICSMDDTGFPKGRLFCPTYIALIESAVPWPPQARAADSSSYFRPLCLSGWLFTWVLLRVWSFFNKAAWGGVMGLVWLCMSLGLLYNLYRCTNQCVCCNIVFLVMRVSRYFPKALLCCMRSFLQVLYILLVSSFGDW